MSWIWSIAVALILSSGSVSHAGTDAKSNNASLIQSWCTDGTFRFTLNGTGMGLVGPEANCALLTSTGLWLPRVAELRRNLPLERPSGNLEEYLARTVFDRPEVTYRMYPNPVVTSFRVKAGRCQAGGRPPFSFFVVEQVELEQFPHFQPGPGRMAFDQCAFEGGPQVVSSAYLLGGVYERADGQSLDGFVRTLTAK